MITRRQFTIGAGAAAVAAGLPGLARARDYAPGEILDNLSKTIWASTKPGASRAAYVVAAPWCGVCHRLYQMQAGLGADCDFRFVFMDPRRPDLKRRINEAVLAQAPDKAAVVYGDATGAELSRAQADSDFIIDVNSATVSPMWERMGRLSGAPRMGYPTLVAPLEGRVLIVPGIPNHFAEMVGKIEPHAAETLAESPIQHLAPRPPVLRSRGGARFARADGAKLHSAPDGNAPVMELVGKGRGYNIAGTAEVGGVEWIAFRFFDSGSAYLWGSAEDFMAG